MYKVTFSRLSYKQFKKLPMNEYVRVFNAIGLLMSDSPTPNLDIIKLTDQGGHRLRVGDYRILYTKKNKGREIDIESIAHRKDAY